MVEIGGVAGAGALFRRPPRAALVGARQALAFVHFERRTPRGGQAAHAQRVPAHRRQHRQAAGAVAVLTQPALFDHLVGACQQRLGYRNTYRISGLEIHDQIEPLGLLDRQVFWPGSPQDFGGEAGDKL